MARITLNSSSNGFTSVAPYGNLSVQRFDINTNASGKPLFSDATGAVAVGDVIDLGGLQEGLRLDDAQIVISTAMSSGVTGRLGFLYEDGIDDPKNPQDEAYFGSNLNLAAAARIRSTGSKLVRLPKPARLVLTLGGAANAKESKIDFLIYGEHVGAR